MSYPRLTLAPPVVTRVDDPVEHKVIFRVDQQIIDLCRDGLVPLATLPGHDPPRDLATLLAHRPGADTRLRMGADEYTQLSAALHDYATALERIPASDLDRLIETAEHVYHRGSLFPTDHQAAIPELERSLPVFRALRDLRRAVDGDSR